MRRLAAFSVFAMLTALQAPASYARGMFCSDRTEAPSEFNERTPINVLEPAARAGDAQAMHALGLAIGDERPAEGARWTLAGARAGNTDAMVYAATLYATGYGVPKSLTSARQWLRRASDRGDAEGMLLMAASYDPALLRLFGMKVPADYPRAVEWYEAAAIRGCESAARRLQYMYAEGEGVARDKPNADRWWARVEEIQKAADRKMPTAPEAP